MNRLWIQTPAKTRQRVAFVIVIAVPPLLLQGAEIQPQVTAAELAGGAAGAQPKIAYETEEDTVVAGMAAAGFGIAIVPDHPVLRCLDLKILPITAPDSGRTAYLCRKRSAQLPEAASSSCWPRPQPPRPRPCRLWQNSWPHKVCSLQFAPAALYCG